MLIPVLLMLAGPTVSLIITMRKFGDGKAEVNSSATRALLHLLRRLTLRQLVTYRRNSDHPLRSKNSDSLAPQRNVAGYYPLPWVADADLCQLTNERLSDQRWIGGWSDYYTLQQIF